MQISISVNEFGSLNIAEVINGVEHRRCLVPTDNLVGELPEVIATAKVVWTPTVVANYQLLLTSRV